MGSLKTRNMNTPRGTVLRTSSPEFGIKLIVMKGLEQVEIFDFHMPRHSTFILRNL